jgi:YD repeat-containing protein
MVAIVSGKSLGLNLTSLSVLGKQLGSIGSASIGRTGATGYVNAATGNLVLQSNDDLLVGRGLSVESLRTYNSQGRASDDNGDNWSLGTYTDQLQLEGTINTAGSRFIRTDRDGSRSTYRFNATRNLYVSNDGDGAYDTIENSTGGMWLWRDGSSGLEMRYDSSNGLLKTVTDSAGYSLSYAYSPVGLGNGETFYLLTGVTTSNGEATFYDYNGTKLTQIRTSFTGPNGPQTEVRTKYEYDSDNRLEHVTVDLTPENTADNLTYRTTYRYEGHSNRVSQIIGQDGSSTSIQYELVDGKRRVSRITDAEGVSTDFSYDTANGSFRALDVASGQATQVFYDDDGQIVRVSMLAANGQEVERRDMAYNGRGDVDRITDGAGLATTFKYDPEGNRTLEEDAAGNKIRRKYDGLNRLVNETVVMGVDPASGTSLPSSTVRYVYHPTLEDRLLYTVSATGRVTEYLYEGPGHMLRSGAIEYLGEEYDLAGLAADDSLTVSQLQGWTTARRAGPVKRTDMAYDGRGQLSAVTLFAKTGTNGVGVYDGSESTTRYVYDQAGQLLQTITPRQGTSIFTYDGLGRLRTSRDANGTLTTTEYLDTINATTVTFANGRVQTSGYDKVGRLLSVLESSPGLSLGATQYAYDSLGNLRMTTDPTGARHWMLYDAANRKTADIDANGTMTHYWYHPNGMLAKQTTYARAVNTAALVDAGRSANVTADGIAPTRNALADLTKWFAYDQVNRLVMTVSSDGAAVRTDYDGASHIVRTTAYGTPVSVAGLPDLLPQGGLSVASSATDRTARLFYDKDGRLIGQLDAEGYVVWHRYELDPVRGMRTVTTRFAKAAAESLRASGTFAQLRQSANAAETADQDIVTVVQYNAKGQIDWERDGEKYRTDHVYDLNGNKIREIRSGIGETQVTQWKYDDLNRLIKQTRADGMVTDFAYDDVGNLVRSTLAVGEPDARTLRQEYDAFGRVTRELSAEGAARLAPGMTKAEREAIWQRYSVKHQYDKLGRRTSTTDQLGQRTVFYYDLDGQLTFTINALGEVTENHYNDLGQIDRVTAYATRLGANLTKPEADQLIASLAGGRVLDFTVTANAQQDRTKAFTYNSGGYVNSITDSRHTTTISYNAFGQEQSRTTALGALGLRTDTTTYDRRGLLDTVVQDVGGIAAEVVQKWDAFGRLKEAYDANHNLRTWSYDRLGRVVEVKGPAGEKGGTTYDAFSRVLTKTDANRQVTTFQHDTAARSVTVTSPEGVRVRTAVSAHGQTISVTDGRQNTTTYKYDLHGNLKETLAPGASSSKTYDEAGRLFEETDARQNKVRYKFDAANRLIERLVDPGGLNLLTVYQYNAFGEQSTVSVTDAANVVTQYEYDREGNLRQQTVDPTSGGLNLATVFEYDEEGRTVRVTSPGGVSTIHVYDKLGRRVQTRVEGGTLTDPRVLITTFEYDDSGNMVYKTEPGGAITRYAYDANDRLKVSISATGAVARYEYDNEGRLTRTTGYQKALRPEELVVLPLVLATAQAESIALTLAQPGKDAVDGRRYDADGRLKFTVDGTGAVVRLRYDDSNNVIERIAYANAVALWDGASDPAVVPDDTRDQRVRTRYDALNRAIFRADEIGAVTEWRYDPNGNVEKEIAYLDTVAPNEEPGNVSAGGERVSTFTYDKANRLQWSADASGAVVERKYDQYGNVEFEKRYAEKLTPGTDPRGVHPGQNDRETRHVYDKAGRRTYVVDATRHVQEWTYDLDGNVQSTTRFAADLPVGREPAGITRQLGLDRVDRYTYYRDGKIATHSDAANANPERYEYDGLGHLKRYTNQKNAEWNYIYDAAGNLLEERSPAVPRTGMDGLSQEATADTEVVTRMTYDALGNLRTKTEAVGLREQRVTEYFYDARGQQVGIKYPAVEVYSGETGAQLAANGSGGNATRSEGLRELRSTTFYDAFGNAVANIDVAGNVSYKAYDQAGRVRYEIDALGHVTRNGYNAFGEPTEVIRSSIATGLANWVPANYRDAPTVSQVDAELFALGAGSAPFRVLEMKYDAMGRLVETKEPEALSLDVPGGASLAGTRRTTTNKYNAFGDLTYTDVSGATTYHYYDKLGREERTIDAMGYVTRREFDEVGNVKLLVEYAKQATGYGLEGYGGVDGSPDFDRTTRYEYDLLNRKTREVRLGVQYSLDGGSTTRGDLATEYGYDAVGNLTRTTDASGASVYSYYDAQGRVTAVASAARKTGAGAQDATVTPLTLFLRDALGNVVVKTDFANGSAAQHEFKENVTVANYSAAFTFTGDAQDRRTVTHYDSHGHAVDVQDAEGYVHHTSYDALGRVAKTWQQVLAFDGMSQTTMFQAFQYDKVGRLTHTYDPGPLTLDGNGNFVRAGSATDTEIRYNAFGEITSRLVDGHETERFHYDGAGRIERTNSGDGVYKVFLYDTQGRRVSEIRSNGISPLDLSTAAIDTLAASLGETRRTDTAYDALGRVIQQWLPSRDEMHGGVTQRSRSTSAEFVETQLPQTSSNDSGTVFTHWSGKNSLKLRWSVPLSELGAGEVKVELRYVSGKPPLVDGQSGLPEQGPVTVTRIFPADEANEGCTFDWVAGEGQPGGFELLLGMTVSKKDVSGNWHTITDQTALGNAGYTVELKLPDDPSATTRIEFTNETTGQTIAPVGINFGSAQWFDLAGLAAGGYRYQYFTKAVGQAEQLVSSGRFDMTTPPLASIDTPIAFEEGSAGILSWAKPAFGTVQQFNYRPANAAGPWKSLLVDTRELGKDRVDASVLPVGDYEFELLWSSGVSGLPHSHAVGTFQVGNDSVATPLSGIRVQNNKVTWDSSIGVTGTVSGVGTSEITGLAVDGDRLSWTAREGEVVVEVKRAGEWSWSTPAVEVGTDGRPFFDLSSFGAGQHQVRIRYAVGGETAAFASFALDRGAASAPALKSTVSSLDGFALTATQMRWQPRAGSVSVMARGTGSQDWAPVTVEPQDGFDTINLTGVTGNYEYVITYATEDGVTAVQRGTVVLSDAGAAPQHSLLSTQLSLSLAAGVLEWPTHAGVLRVEGRQLGTGDWGPVEAQVDGNRTYVDVSGLLPGSYDYRVIYSDDASEDAQISAFALGSVTIPSGGQIANQAQGRIAGFVVSGSTMRWTAMRGTPRFEYLDEGSGAWTALDVTTAGEEAWVSTGTASGHVQFRVSYLNSSGVLIAFAAGAVDLVDADGIPGAQVLAGTPVFSWRRVGDTAWVTAEVDTTAPGRASVDISALGAGEFEFRAAYVSAPAEPGGDLVVHAGSNMRVTLYPESSAGVVNLGTPHMDGFEVDGTHLQWAAQAGDASFEFRKLSDEEWTVLTVVSPEGSDGSQPASIDLGALPGGDYEFRVVYRNGGITLTRAAGDLLVNATGGLVVATPSLALTDLTASRSALSWSARAGEPQLEIRAAGQTEWSTLEVSTIDGHSSVDISVLPEGMHEIRLSYRSASGVLYAFGAGTLMVGDTLTNLSASSVITDFEVTPTSMSWERPGGSNENEESIWFPGQYFPGGDPWPNTAVEHDGTRTIVDLSNVYGAYDFNLQYGPGVTAQATVTGSDYVKALYPSVEMMNLSGREISWKRYAGQDMFMKKESISVFEYRPAGSTSWTELPVQVGQWDGEARWALDAVDITVLPTPADYEYRIVCYEDLSGEKGDPLTMMTGSLTTYFEPNSSGANYRDAVFSVSRSELTWNEMSWAHVVRVAFDDGSGWTELPQSAVTRGEQGRWKVDIRNVYSAQPIRFRISGEVADGLVLSVQTGVLLADDPNLVRSPTLSNLSDDFIAFAMENDFASWPIPGSGGTPHVLIRPSYGDGEFIPLDLSSEVPDGYHGFSASDLPLNDYEVRVLYTDDNGDPLALYHGSFRRAVSAEVTERKTARTTPGLDASLEGKRLTWYPYEVGTPRFEYRKEGTTDWIAGAPVNHDAVNEVDSVSIDGMAGRYEYRIIYTDGASGMMALTVGRLTCKAEIGDVTGPSDPDVAAVATPKAVDGRLQWSAPGVSYFQSRFEYRPADGPADGPWSTLAIEGSDDGHSVAYSELPEGEYEYRISYETGVGTSAMAVALGRGRFFTSEPVPAGAVLQGNVPPESFQVTRQSVSWAAQPGAAKVSIWTFEGGWEDLPAEAIGHDTASNRDSVNISQTYSTGDIRFEISYLDDDGKVSCLTTGVLRATDPARVQVPELSALDGAEIAFRPVQGKVASWELPAHGGSASLLVRPTGSTDEWTEVQLTLGAPAGCDSWDFSDVSGSYDFRLSYADANGRVQSFARGTLDVPSQVGAQRTQVADYVVSEDGNMLSWLPPSPGIGRIQYRATGTQPWLEGGEPGVDGAGRHLAYLGGVQGEIEFRILYTDESGLQSLTTGTLSRSEDQFPVLELSNPEIIQGISADDRIISWIKDSDVWEVELLVRELGSTEWTTYNRYGFSSAEFGYVEGSAFEETATTVSWRIPERAADAGYEFAIHHYGVDDWSRFQGIGHGIVRSAASSAVPAPSVTVLPAEGGSGPGGARSYNSNVNTAPNSPAVSFTTANPALHLEHQGGGQTKVTLQPVISQTVDRWGNVLSTTDPRNADWKTTYVWDASNHLVKQIRLDGTVQAATTEIYYDAAGSQVGTRDAKGYLNTQRFNAAGQLVEEVHADEGRVTYVYDAFGQRREMVGAEANRAEKTAQQRLDATKVYQYDKLGRLKSVDQGVAAVYGVDSNMQVTGGERRHLVETYEYDQAGRKTEQVNAAGEKTLFAYDAAGHVVQTMRELSGVPIPVSVSKVAYDVYGNKAVEIDANGRRATWDTDAFGRMRHHTDLGGQQITYGYDEKTGQLTSKASNNYLMLGTNTLQVGQDVTYSYDRVGQLLEINDKKLNNVTTYAYDLSGNHVREKTVQDGIILQDNHLAYDGFGRLGSVADGRVFITFGYDGNGNRTSIDTNIWVQDKADSGSGDKQMGGHRSFAYDKMNRQVVVDDDGNGGGHVIGYDKDGNRTSDTYIGTKIVAANPGQLSIDDSGQAVYVQAPSNFSVVEKVQVVEQYQYDAVGRLVSTARDGVQIDHRRYDAANRVVASGPQSLPAGYADKLGEDAAKGISVQRQVNQYDERGRLLKQKVFKADGSDKYTITNERFDDAGNVKRYVLQEGDENIVYQYEFGAYDGYVESKATVGTGGYKDGDEWYFAHTGTVVSKYDANGHLAQIDDHSQDGNDKLFYNDAAGQALLMKQGTELLGHKLQRQLIVNGEVLGRFGIGPNELKPRGAEGPDFVPVAEFNFGYQGINGNFPGPSPGLYTVQAGDTLQSIARGAYGDSQLWYKIAEANGLRGDADIRVGQSLVIPTSPGGLHNTADTFEPYDPSKITGDRTPTVPAPGEKCGGMGALIVAIVVIVVAVITQQYWLANYATPVSGSVAAGTAVYSTGSMVVAGAVGGAAGAVAGQFVGNAIGVMDGFDLKGIALGALGGAITGGLNGFNLTSGASVAIDAAARAAVGSALTQGIAVVTGLQEKFSWRNVAAAAVGAGVGAAVGDAMGMNTAAFKTTAGLGEKIAATAVSGLVGGAAGLLVATKGRITTAKAADSFGNVIGTAIASAMQPGINYSAEEMEGDFAREKNRFSSAALLNASTSGRRADAWGMNAPMIDRFEGESFAGSAAAPRDIVKVGASERWHEAQRAIYNGLQDLSGALSAGGEDPQRLAQLRSSLGAIDGMRRSIQADQAMQEELLARGLTFRDDIGRIALLGAFGDPDTVHRIAVATAQAGGAGRASGEAIAAHLTDLEPFGPSFVNRIPGDGRVEAAAPGLYLNTLLGMRSHVDSTMLYVASMTDAQMRQLGSYADSVMAAGGLARPKDTESLGAIWTGAQVTVAGLQRFGEGLSVAAFGLRKFAGAVHESLRNSSIDEASINASLRRMGVPFNVLPEPMYVVPPGLARVNFGAHLRSLKGAPPEGMIDPHAHHILFKEGNGAVQKALVAEGQALLRSYDIDPIMGPENLVWAPNRVSGQHGVDALRGVVTELKQVHELIGTRDAMVKKLNELGQLAARRR